MGRMAGTSKLMDNIKATSFIQRFICNRAEAACFSQAAYPASGQRHRTFFVELAEVRDWKESVVVSMDIDDYGSSSVVGDRHLTR